MTTAKDAFDFLGITNTPCTPRRKDSTTKRCFEQGGTGALYSTVEDLYRWNEGIFTGKVLKPASLDAAFTPVKTEANTQENSREGYGYGWSLQEFRGTREISHGGG